MSEIADEPESGQADKTAVVKSITRVFPGFLSVDEAVVSHSRYDGRRQTVTRQSLERGDSVAILMVDRKTRKVWLTEQFRYSTFAKGPGWLTELPAGMIKPGEDPEACARREAGEETGFAPSTLEHIATFYVSPGGTSERIFLYFAAVDGATRDAGLAERTRDTDEDIKLVDRDVDAFMDDSRLGRIDDAKTLIAGLWLASNRARIAI